VVKTSDPAPSDQASLQALAGTRGTRWGSCIGASHGLAAHMDTASGARDVEAIRRVLGEPRISALGVSYGTLTAQAYAERYGDRLRALVLTSVVDHTRNKGAEAAEEGRNADELFGYFASWAATNSLSALHGQDAKTILLNLLRHADATPIPAGKAQPVGGDEIRGLIIQTAYSNEYRWPNFTTRIAQAAAGNATGLREMLSEGGVIDQSDSAVWATFCADWPVISDRYDAIVHTLGRAAHAGPVMAGPHLDVATAVSCQGWPLPLAYPPHRLHVRQGPPALLVNPRYDPATAHSGAQRVASQLPHSVLLTVDGAAHAVLEGGCQIHISRYLIDGKLPDPHASCPLR